MLVIALAGDTEMIWYLSSDVENIAATIYPDNSLQEVQNFFPELTKYVQSFCIFGEFMIWQ